MSKFNISNNLSKKQSYIFACIAPDGYGTLSGLARILRNAGANILELDATARSGYASIFARFIAPLSLEDSADVFARRIQTDCQDEIAANLSTVRGANGRHIRISPGIIPVEVYPEVIEDSRWQYSGELRVANHPGILATILMILTDEGFNITDHIQRIDREDSEEAVILIGFEARSSAIPQDAYELSDAQAIDIKAALRERAGEIETKLIQSRGVISAHIVALGLGKRSPLLLIGSQKVHDLIGSINISDVIGREVICSDIEQEGIGAYTS